MERGGAFGMDWRSRPWDDLGFGGNSNGKRADVKLIDLDNLQSGTPHMADDLPCGWQRLLQKATDYRLPATAAPWWPASRPSVPTKPEHIQPVQPKRPAHILWAALIARIYEVFPLLCPICSGQMRIIAFITHSADIRQILEHIGAETEPPRIAPARGPPLWAEADAGVGAGVQAEGAQAMEPLPDWGEGCQAAPDFEVDQRVSW